MALYLLLFFRDCNEIDIKNESFYFFHKKTNRFNFYIKNESF